MNRIVVIALVLGCSSTNSPPSSGGADGSVDPVDSGTTGTLDSMPDGNGCATQPCDVLTQCGCASLESCDINDTDTGTACRGTSGGKDGSSCATSTACASRYTCGFVGAGGNCLRYCANDAECIGPRGQCVIQLADSSGHPVPVPSLCSSNCDPTAISDPLCPAGWGCDLSAAGSRKIVECRIAGTGTQGQACSVTAPCAPGLTCATFASGPSKCARTCAPPASTGCPAATTCVAFAPPYVVGGTQYGVCL